MTHRVRTELLVLLSATLFASTACGDNTKPAMSLEEYAKLDCAITTESGQRMRDLSQEFLNNLSHPSALADSASGMAQIFADIATKIEQLGDPPNGEGKGGAGAAAALMRTAGDQITQIAADIRSSKDKDQIMVNLKSLNQAMSNTGPMIAEFKAKYPTPELDKLEKQIPGCLD